MTDEHLPADELIARMRRVYGECQTYADEGEQTTVFVMNDDAEPRGHTNHKTFRTRWHRPNWFFFEYRDEDFGPEKDWSRYSIWSTPTGVRSWWTVQPRIDSWDALFDALGAAHGVSGGSSTFVARLLHGMNGRSVPGEASGFWGERVELDGTTCLRIPMMHHDGDESWLWIDESSALVLRVDEVARLTRGRHIETLERAVREFSSDEIGSKIDAKQRAQMLTHFREDLARDDFREFTTERTTTYRPLLGIELGPESFAFEPPTSG